MPDEVLVESRRQLLSLTDLQAAALRSVGKQLVGSKAFWRDDDQTDQSEESTVERTVVRCNRISGSTHEVLVSDAVGIIAVPGLQLIVEPKVIQDHFHYLMLRSPAFPRVVENRAAAAEAPVLWDLVAAWFLSALERLLREGILSGYEERSDLLPAVRGSVRVQETALAYYQGSMALACDYEEFSPDTPLNRVLRAAALAIAHTAFLDPDLRRRARRSLARLDEVGDLRRSDLRAALDRRTARYESALALARHVLAATGRTFAAGHQRAQTFLVRTPGLVEEAVREVLRDGLQDLVRVTKHGLQLQGSKHTLNPDLVFGRDAIGDVKYKLVGQDWKRSDLYQAVAFATGYGVHHAAIVTFTATPDPAPYEVKVGNVGVRALMWDCSPTTTPADAARSIVAQAESWFAHVRDPVRTSPTRP
jgi:McrBC 5-methylcytosine restriction system component